MVRRRRAVNALCGSLRKGTHCYLSLSIPLSFSPPHRPLCLAVYCCYPADSLLYSFTTNRSVFANLLLPSLLLERAPRSLAGPFRYRYIAPLFLSYSLFLLFLFRFSSSAMGFFHSREDRLTDAEAEALCPDPRRLFLIFGRPGLRYFREKQKGPLLFHVDSDEQYEAQDGGGTSCYPLSASIPTKQRFEIEPVGPGTNNFAMAKLHFDLSASKPIRRVSVYVDVRMTYESGVGLVLKRGTQLPADQHCVLSVVGAKEGRYTTSLFPLTKLESHHYKPIAPHSGTCRLVSAPIAIVLYMGECTSVVGPSPATTPRENIGGIGAPGPPASRSPLPGPPATAPQAPSPRHGELDGSEGYACVQYTFFSLPCIPRGWCPPAAVPAPPRAGGATTARKVSTAASDGLTAGSEASTIIIQPQQSSLSANSTSAADRTGTQHTLRHRGATSPEGAAPQHSLYFVWEGGILKQMLQMNHELYELEDVFEMGVTDNDMLPTDGGGGGEEEEDDGDICAICLYNPKNTTLLPCRHMCCCEECAAQVRLTSNKCPICRTVIQKTMTL
eukprot:gene9561-6717_t